MASTVLELSRSGHEEMEVGENRIVKLLAAETKTHKQKLIQQHKVLKEVKCLQRVAAKLVDTYEDKDGGRKQELESMTGADVFGPFYNKLRDLREYHRKFPNLYYDQGPTDQEINLADDPEILGQFSAEEMTGRFLDVTALHQKFINLKNAKAVSYDVYLTLFLEFGDVPANVKTKKYRDYLQELQEYLAAFLTRSQPLVDTKAALEGAYEEAMQKELPSSGPKIEGDDLERTIDLSSFTGEEQLVEIGADTLKEELQKLGLKCGGSVAERAKRLWSTKDFSLRSELDVKIVAPSLVAKKKEGASEDALLRDIVVLEAQLVELGDLLEECVANTKMQVQKKQSRTTEELQKEMENEMGDDEPESESDDDDGEEKPVYNPKKVPLDWTGKPIPYWLYKLHGLNIEYKCEICGNFSYWGPRAFERHFQEWRHAHGMRCLKVPNTRAFHNITKIQDATDLFERLKKESKARDFDSQNQEEFEDAAGNVLSKKTYQDLLRQGLL